MIYRKKKTNVVRFGEWGGRYCVYYEQFSNIYIAVTRVIHYMWRGYTF